MIDVSLPTPKQPLPPMRPLSWRVMVFVAGAVAAVHIVGCTTEESSSTGGSGGSSNNVAGADGGARDTAPEAAPARR
jgi:hypothetical protein